jgi:hypothetical protein
MNLNIKVFIIVHGVGVLLLLLFFQLPLDLSRPPINSPPPPDLERTPQFDVPIMDNSAP